MTGMASLLDLWTKSHQVTTAEQSEGSTHKAGPARGRSTSVDTRSDRGSVGGDSSRHRVRGLYVITGTVSSHPANENWNQSDSTAVRCVINPRRLVPVGTLDQRAASSSKPSYFKTTDSRR